MSDPIPQSSSSSGVNDRSSLVSPGTTKAISNWGVSGGMGMAMGITMRSVSPAHRPVSPLTTAINPAELYGKGDDRSLERGNSTGSSQSGNTVLQPLKHMWGE